MAHDPSRQNIGSRAIAILRDLFIIDLRSLALFRISIATLVLIDLALHAQYLRAHFTNFGVLPTWAVEHVFNPHPWFWSLHMASGTLLWQVILFLVAGTAAVALLLGFKTRWATFITWLLLASIHTRHPTLMNGGDNLMRMLMFWSIFLPLSACWSLDARRAYGSTTRPSVFSAASVAIMLQLLIVY